MNVWEIWANRGTSHGTRLIHLASQPGQTLCGQSTAIRRRRTGGWASAEFGTFWDQGRRCGNCETRFTAMTTDTPTRRLHFKVQSNPDIGFRSRYLVTDEGDFALGSVQQDAADGTWALSIPSKQMFQRGYRRRFDAAQTLYAEQHGWDAAMELGRKR